jgi:hypothetical protein
MPNLLALNIYNVSRTTTQNPEHSDHRRSRHRQNHAQPPPKLITQLHLPTYKLTHHNSQALHLVQLRIRCA